MVYGLHFLSRVVKCIHYHKGNPMRTIKSKFRRMSTWSVLIFGLSIGIQLKGATVHLNWNPNTEADLRGYKVYYGHTSRIYSTIIDVGKVTQCDITSLQVNQTYFFAVTAYDVNGNEGNYSTEAVFRVEDEEPPQIVSVTCDQADRVVIVFNEAVEKTSAELTANYAIENMVVQRSTLQTDLKTVHLFTTQHAIGSYILTVNNVRDLATIPNTIQSDTRVNYVWSIIDKTPPSIRSVALQGNAFLIVEFSEVLDQASALAIQNYTITPSIQITNSAIDGDFKKVYLTTANHPAGAYALTVNNVKDAANPPNSIVPNSQISYRWEAEDTDPPVLIAVRLMTPVTLELEFSEQLDPVSSQTLSNYGIVPPVDIISAVLSIENTKVELTTAEHQGGVYTVAVQGVGDDANPSIKMGTAQLSYTYMPPDQTPPLLIAVELTSNNLLQLYFDEMLDQATAENISNYRIEPAVGITKSILDVTKRIVLLQTGAHPAGSYRVIMNDLKDLAQPGNIIAAETSLEYDWDPPDVAPPVLQSAEMHGSDLVELVFSEPLDRSTGETASNFQIAPPVVIIEASLVGEGFNRVYLKTYPHDPGQSYMITVSGIMDRAPAPNAVQAGSQVSYVCPLFDNIAPKLESVELQGIRLLQLVFSEPMDQASVEDIQNYSIEPALEILQSTLDVTRKIVFLKTQAHQPGTRYTVTVQNVTDRADPPNLITSPAQLSYLCESEDREVPLLLRADMHGNQTLELIFNEPLDRTSTIDKTKFTIDQNIQVQGVTLSQTQKEVWLQTSPHDKGTYTVTVLGLKDQATVPNTITAEQTALYIYTPVDTLPPVLVSTVLLNPTTVELIFDEPLGRSSVENIANYSISNDVTVGRAILDISSTKVYLQTSTHNQGGYIITINGIQDASGYGNIILPNTQGQYSYIIEDKTPPALANAWLKTDRMLIVDFSEPLDASTAENAANYVINNGIRIQNLFLGSSHDQIVVETSAHTTGDYILTVNGLQDASPSKNMMAPYSQIRYTWSPVDTVSPVLTGARLITDTYLELEFSELIDAEESQKTGNYTIQPGVQVRNAVLDASNLKKVYLLTEAHNPGKYTVTVQNIKDRSFLPNPIRQNQAEYSYTPPDTVAPVLVSVQLRTPMSLALTFDEPLNRQSVENKANYTISPNIEITQASLLASLTTIHLETTSHQQRTEYTLTIRGISDRAPIPNSIHTLQNTYSYMPPDTSAPKLLAVKLHGMNLIELAFNEPLEKMSAEKRENYRIDPDVEVLNASLDATSLSKVYLETTNHFPMVGYQINVRNVKDRAAIPNTISPNTWMSYSMMTSGGAADNTPPQIARVDVLSATKVDIVFTEPVDKLTAENKNNYFISDSITVQTVKLDSASVRVHLTTSAHSSGKSYAIRVANIKDMATQPNAMPQATPVRYMLQKGVIISNINKSLYDLKLFHAGDTTYTDRNYTVTQIPEYLEGAVQLRTANDDKAAQGSAFLTFELSGEAALYLAYDKCIAQVPEWLSQWKPTGDQVVNSRSSVYQVYSKDVKTGRVVTGANQGTVDDNMYLMFLVPHYNSEMVLAQLSKSSYQLQRMTVGDPYYIDRDYTIASVPSALEGLLWIRTANDDKTDRDTDFLTFTLNQKSKIYAAFDAKIAALPKWVADWEEFEGQVVDSRGTKFDIFYREFPSGEVQLGGNCGSVDDNMYLIIIEPLESQLDGGESKVPGYFTLTQNYPNPFNPSTTIRYTVEKPGRVTLSIYNVIGQLVKVLVDREIAERCVEEVVWDSRDERGNPVASGIYFYRIQQGQFAKARRMLLMR